MAFIGTREGVIADATTFVERVKSVGGQLNEDTTDLAALVRTSDVYGGIHMDLTNKTTRLADKTITKLKYSWARRESWTWRNFEGQYRNTRVRVLPRASSYVIGSRATG